MTHVAEMTYNKGDIIFLCDRSSLPYVKVKIVEIKEYKRGRKIICSDKSEWDERNGHLWGTRSTNWYSGPYISPFSEELQEKFMIQKYKNHIKLLASKIESLSPEQLKEIGSICIRINKEKQ